MSRESEQDRHDNRKTEEELEAEERWADEQADMQREADLDFQDFDYSSVPWR